MAAFLVSAVIVPSDMIALTPDMVVLDMLAANAVGMFCKSALALNPICSKAAAC